MWRHLAWTSLLALILVVACGPTTVTDINDGASGDDDIGGDDDDDDDAATTFPTATTPPGAQPTLTNVPSFATWDSTIRPLGCSQCHTGGSGGLYMDPSDANNKKYYWFSAICNRGSGNDKSGTQTYNPASGRFQAFYNGQSIDMNGDGDTADMGEVHTGTNPSGGATVITWLQTGTVPPPNCSDFYDLTNSN